MLVNTQVVSLLLDTIDIIRLIIKYLPDPSSSRFPSLVSQSLRRFLDYMVPPRRAAEA